jgi:hypothetical protein
MKRIGETKMPRDELIWDLSYVYFSLCRIEYYFQMCLGILAMAVSLYAAIKGQSVAQQPLPLPSFSYPSS